jgi:hypothetical protein
VTPTTTRLARRSGVLLVAAALPLLTAAPAVAEVPEGWSHPEDVSALQLLTVLVGFPLLLFVLIVAACLVGPLARGEKLLPSTSTPDQWFGGPDRPAGELESSSRSTGPTGGASGSW